MKTQEDINVNEIDALGSETLSAIYQGQKDKVILLYAKVESVLMTGSELSRSLIATRFVLPISRLLEMNYSWGKEYLKLFPELLRMEYYRQVNATCM